MGNLYRFTSNPIGYPAPFAAEQDMETFLVEHMGLMGEHLGTGDSEADVLKAWRQMHLPRRGAAGRLDLLFLTMDGTAPALYLAELKNEPIGKGAVKQVTEYLESWRTKGNAKNRATVANWLTGHTEVAAPEAEAAALNVQGLLVAPAYTSDGVEAVVEWAKKKPDSPVQALKLLRFRAGDGEGHVVLVDDVFVRARRGQRVSFRWTDLVKRLPDLVGEDTVFVLTLRGGNGTLIEATPDLVGGRGKNLVVSDKQRKSLLDKLARAEEMSERLGWSEWEGPKIRTVHDLVRARQSVPMSNLALYVQRAFGGEKELDWQRPAHLWRRRDDPPHTIHELDKMLL